MATNLHLRLKKLEAVAAARSRGFPITILVGVYDYNQDDVVGAGTLDKVVMRYENETTDALSARASSVLGMQVLFAIYKDGKQAC